VVLTVPPPCRQPFGASGPSAFTSKHVGVSRRRVHYYQLISAINDDQNGINRAQETASHKHLAPDRYATMQSQ
jgi:hypothetical protein